MSEQERRREEFLDDVAGLVDGDATVLRKHADLLESSDECRDLRHEAAEAAEFVAAAGADYVVPADVEALVGRVMETGTPGTEEKAPSQPVRSAGVGTFGSPHEKDVKSVSRKEALAFAAGLFALVVLVAVLSNRHAADVQQRGAAVLSPHDLSHARIDRVLRASDDELSGVEVRLPGEKVFRSVKPGVEIGPGATLRTDGRTRVQLSMRDGTHFVLNHATVLTLDREKPRCFEMSGGEVLADVVPLEKGPRVELVVPTGRVEVMGTKFVLSADAHTASVRVTRGHVRAANAAGDRVDARAGQEITLPKNGQPSVAAAVDLASSIAWSEMDSDMENTHLSTSGLGQLRAKRPGDTQAREHRLSLSRHVVRVRITGNIARTEIEETFRNDSGQALEGIYGFPLPRGARIARLALDVDGRMEEGAIVERNQAAKIWRGVIRNATPQPRRRPNEEYVWVPGPWRDPALLEWKRGGKFELRIFPIPAHGERTVILGYTETIAPHGQGRRYVYPLAHSKDASTKVGRFEMDIRVAGDPHTSKVVVRGYDAQVRSEENATTVVMVSEQFLPAGDVVVDYRLAQESGLRFWTFNGSTTADLVRSGTTPTIGDDRAFALFALRPEIPAWSENKPRDYVLVVDSSQSMVGERFSRASSLVASLVSEMDRRDRFTVLACDAACQTMASVPVYPSSQAASEVRTWLKKIRPAGASDIGATLRAAARAAEKSDRSRVAHIIYLGDGVATVGSRRLNVLVPEAASLAMRHRFALSTVAVGTDGDGLLLSALARASGGHYVPFVPGQTATAAALSILETTYGASLRNAVLEFPEGVEAIAPSSLPNLRMGEELLVAARFSGEVRGEVILKGNVADRPFVANYPLELKPSTSVGNAFVARQWAANTIEQLELDEAADHREQIVALSKQYGVLSRETSLLVLESEAMFRAFGVERGTLGAEWASDEEPEPEESVVSQPAGLSIAGHGSGGGGRAVGRAPMGTSDAFSRFEGAPAPRASSAPTTATSPRRSRARDNEIAAETDDAPVSPREDLRAQALPVMPVLPDRGQWMRRVYVRVGEIRTSASPSPEDFRRVRVAELALSENPNSRDRHRTLVRALSRAGELDEAIRTTEQWLTRDPMDPEALTYLADAYGRLGKRDDAIRLLSGIVDLDTDNRVLHERLVAAFERAGMTDRACSHRIALAEIVPDDASLLALAVDCERALHRTQTADQLLENAPIQARSTLGLLPNRSWNARPSLRGDVLLDASWSAPDDLDLSLITPQGTRISWMGGRTTVFGTDAVTRGHEVLGLKSAPVGTYLIEVSRARSADDRPVRGRLRVQVLGMDRQLAFTLSGTRATIGQAVVRREARLEPVR